MKPLYLTNVIKMFYFPKINEQLLVPPSFDKHTLHSSSSNGLEILKQISVQSALEVLNRLGLDGQISCNEGECM